MLMLYKSCRVFTRNPKNFSLHFSECSTILYVFSKFSQNQILFKKLTTKRSLEKFWKSHIYPCFAERTFERSVPRNVALEAAGGAGAPDSGELAAALGRRCGGECPHAQGGPI
jgi:hypothetical protein